MTITNPDSQGFGVYVHWPFCASKCPYCDFNSHVRHGGVDQAAFAAAYVREIGHLAEMTGQRSVSTIFFGGGTPSLMEPTTLETILDAISKHWAIEAGAEITLEANPSSVEAARFAGYRTAGVNRVSLGVQALDDDALRKLGRLHTVDEAHRALKVAHANFERVSFDLIYARPGQSLQDWERELTAALDMATGHLSLYQLTIEDGTPFAELYNAGRLKIPPSRLADDLFQATQALTSAAGMPAYEISNHARPGEESRHNLLYWRYGEFAGVGPGAHGRLIVRPDRIATSSERQPERWLAAVDSAGHGLVEREILDTRMQADEMLLMGLRIGEGVDLARLAQIGGVAPDAETVAELVDLGLLTADATSGRIAATLRGRFMLNELVLRLAATFQPVSEARYRELMVR